MAGTLNETTKNTLLTSLNIAKIKLHSADPTADGSVGVVQGAEAALTMGAASGGVIASTGAANIAVGAGVTVSHFSLWDNSATAKCLATGALTSSQTFATAGTYVVNSLSVDLNK